MKKYLQTAAAALILILAGWGCSSDECLQNRNALPLAGFYDAADHSRKVSVDSIEVYGVDAPGDSVLFPGKSPISQLYLPFRLDMDTTRYVFRYLHKELAELDIRDTVTFVYTREPRFVSAACGVSYVFSIDSIGTSGLLIDSVACPMGEITNKDMENLSVFFHVATQEEPEPAPN